MPDLIFTLVASNAATFAMSFIALVLALVAITR